MLWVPVSLILFVTKRQSLCLGPLSPLHIHSNEDSVSGTNKGLHSSFVQRRQFFVCFFFHGPYTPYEFLFKGVTMGVV